MAGIIADPVEGGLFMVDAGKDQPETGSRVIFNKESVFPESGQPFCPDAQTICFGANGNAGRIIIMIFPVECHLSAIS